VEKHLVGAEQVLLRGPLDRLLLRDVVRPEGVVIEQEERREDVALPLGRSFAGPGHVRVLRGQHAVLAADGDQAAVLLLAAPVVRLRRDRPQVVVARHPEEAGEAAREEGEGEPQVLLGLSHVPGEDQPVIRMRAQRLQGLARHLVAEVEVGDGVELHQEIS
jgi:hypothetical protein